MDKNKRTLKFVAKSHKIDSDVLLLRLWDHSKLNKFSYLVGDNSIIKKKDLNLVKFTINGIKKENTSSIKEVKSAERKLIDKRSYDFSRKGKEHPSLIFLNDNDITSIYLELVNDYNRSNDPMTPVGIKDAKLLSSAVHHGSTQFEGKLKYPTVHSAAAAIMYSLTHNHPFHNGNKRTAMVAMLVFLDRHNITLTCTEDELFQMSVMLADHKIHDQRYERHADAEVFALTSWIREHSKQIEKGERPIKLKKLKQVLQSFDCSFDNENGITRTIPAGYFGTKKYYSSRIPPSLAEGREVDMGIIKTIREDLHLTEKDNIDSSAFYDGEYYTSAEFIVRYRKTLQRLSRI